MTITEEPDSAAALGHASKQTSPSMGQTARLLEFQAQSVISELHILRQLGLCPVMIIFGGGVGETGAPRPDPPRGGEGFIRAHVRRMRCIAQRVKNRDLHPLASLNRLGRNELAIVEIGQA